jgi:hypothetical protein
MAAMSNYGPVTGTGGTYSATHMHQKTATRVEIPVTQEYMFEVLQNADVCLGYFAVPGSNSGYIHYTSPAGIHTGCVLHQYVPAAPSALHNGEVAVTLGGIATEIMMCPREEWRTRTAARTGGRRAV